MVMTKHDTENVSNHVTCVFEHWNINLNVFKDQSSLIAICLQNKLSNLCL